ncbi:hypothetical protein [Streptomyces sp. NPDC005262]|uniref:hypothetical protein n=1 Tax=Streptomyces sp. NPDC005262 TaxID=3364710 RepID=UPI00367F164C
MKVGRAAVVGLLLVLAVGCGEDDSAESGTAAYGARSCATWLADMDDGDRFLGAKEMLLNAKAADGTEGDVDPDGETIEQFRDGITEACRQTSTDALLANVADDVFAANEDLYTL